MSDAVVINFHKYKAFIQTEYNFIKTGEGSLFWGAIIWPKGYTEKKEYDTGICKHCGKPLIDRLHGKLLADRFN